MPKTQHDLTALRELVAFAEGEAPFQVRLVASGGGLVAIASTSLVRLVTQTPAQLAPIRRELAWFLRAIAATGSATMIAPLQITPTVITHAPQKRQGRSPRGQTSLLINGNPRDVVMDYVWRLLSVGAVDALKICPAPDCDRLFVKVTKKRFCSTRCQSRVYMRAMRAAERAERDAVTTKKKRKRA
jgi:hypothetical protein